MIALNVIGFSTICYISNLVFAQFPTEETMLNYDEIFERYHPFIRVKYETALKTMIIFREEDVQDFQPLLILDNKLNSGHKIIVGARNYVLRLDADLTILDKFSWHSRPEDVQMCLRKGQKEENCHNFIRLIVLQHDILFICGTNASSPSCIYKRLDELGQKNDHNLRQRSGAGFVPTDPNFRNTYTLTQHGRHLVTGVAMDLATRVPSLLRMWPENQILRTDQANERWLNDPVFIGSFEIGNFVYVFFREIAVEVSSYGKFVYPRVARVCKNDVGAQPLGKWSTFTKARLNCSLNSQGNGVNFETLQSVQYVSSLHSIFATFSTAGNGIRGSTVCVYDMLDLVRAFSGPFIYSEGQNMPWSKYENKQPDFDCGVHASLTPNFPNRGPSDVERFQLMYELVQPRGVYPLHFTLFERYIFIQVASMETKLYGNVNMIFILTESGLVKKFSYRPTNKIGQKSQMCLIEVVEIVSKNDPQKFTTFQFDGDQKFLLVGSYEQFTKVPVQHCSRHKSQQQCINARDPYCGWHSLSGRCVTEPVGSFTSGWFQSLDECPDPKTPVDGQLSQWSTWTACPQHNDQSENCHCRTRKCGSPAPMYGGKSCVGPTVQVANCTQHGNWAVWSDWTPCPVTCGSSIRSRRRSCTNPSPAFGGRVCLGLDTQQEFCAFSPCPAPVPPPTNGGWSHWTHWNQCSKPCNNGYQKRRRFCDNPTPSHNGSYCNGESAQYQTCHEHHCPEIRIWSDWTPWLHSNYSTATRKSVELKRYKVACQAKVDDPSMVTMLPYRIEEKTCSGPECHQTDFKSVDGQWSEWVDWSACSKSCGNGTQFRTRQCNEPTPIGNGIPCSGHGRELRSCNGGSCESTWSCWSDYSDCSTTCGQGYRHRQRSCTAGTCPGDRIQSMPCDTGPCSLDGFGEWSGWSTCNKLGVQVRIRPCLSAAYCKDIPDAQMQQCHFVSNEKDFDRSSYLAASTEQYPKKLSLTFLLSITVAFLTGIIISLSLSCCHSSSPSRGRRSWRCPLIGSIKKRSATLSASPSLLADPSAQSRQLATPTLTKSNIYTPPPTLRHSSLLAHHVTSRPNGCHDNQLLDHSTVVKPRQLKQQRWHTVGRSQYGVMVRANPTLQDRLQYARRASYNVDENDYDGLSSDDKETSLSATLKKSVRASMKTQDYL